MQGSKLRHFSLIAFLLISAVCALAQSSNLVALQKQQPVYQLRIYEIFEHNKKAFHDRFKTSAMRIMTRYDFQILAIWESKQNNSTEFVYLLQWPNELTMKTKWAEFMKDEEWIAIKKETSATHGKLVGNITDKILTLTNYSPLQFFKTTNAKENQKINETHCPASLNYHHGALPAGTEFGILVRYQNLVMPNGYGYRIDHNSGTLCFEFLQKEKQFFSNGHSVDLCSSVITSKKLALGVKAGFQTDINADAILHITLFVSRRFSRLFSRQLLCKQINYEIKPHILTLNLK
jgi:hypothetical protein